MSYPAHPKSKQVGVPPTYQQTRHNSAPRHQQYRSQHPQTRDNRYQNLSQPPRHPSPIPNQPQPSASPNTVPPQPPTALGTGTHDMNKQGAPNRPALTPSPVQQGTILSGPGHQGGIIINPQQIMYQQNMPRGQAPQQTMYMPIQANQRGNPRGGYATSNISQTQQGGQPQPTFQPSHQQMTMAAPPFIPSSHHNPQQQQYMTIPQMMMQQPNVYAPRQPVHQLQYQPTAVFQQPNTPPFYQGSPPVSASTGAFFPQNQTLVATQQPTLRAQAPTMTIQQTQPRPAPKERKIIRIVDPSTNSDITDSIMREGGGSSTGSTPTQSGRSSASSTPPASGPPPPTQPNQLNDKARAIQANFAAQVAAVAAAPADATKPLPVMNQTNNSQMQQMVPQQPTYRVPVPVQPQPVAPVAAPPPPKEIPEATSQAAVVVDDTGVKVPLALASQVQKQPSLPIRPSEVATAPTNQVMSHVGPIPAPVPAKISSVHNEEVTDSKPIASEAKSNSVPEKSTESVSSKEVSETSKEEQVSSAPVTISAAEKTDSKPETDSEVSKEDASTTKKEPVAAEKVSSVDTPKVDSRPVETAKQETEKKPLPQEKTEEKSSSVTTEAPTQEATPEVKQQAPVKENKKKANQKKRLAELDKKETKADDLEAFKDPEPSESTPNVTKATEDKKQETKEKEEITNLTSDKTKQEKQPVPEKEAPVVKEAETKPQQLTKSETKEETKPDVESDQLSEEKDVPKVEVDVVDSVDKKEREKVEAENAKNKESMDNEDDSNNKEDLKDNKIQLKYTYREDQWSPVNPEGKKTYGRDFLLQFQPECKDKPDGLPHIPDIVLDKADIRPIAGVADPRLAQQGGGGRSRGGGGGGSDFLPDFLRMSPRGGNQPQPQFPKMGGGRRSSREPKVIKRDERGPEAVLKKTENAWKPESKRAEKPKSLDEQDAKSAELDKTFKAILNKLTPQNFQKLMTQTLALPIDNEERLIMVIDLVFEKAITESAFSKAYANMCRVLSQIKVPSKATPGLVQFRTVLINRCQKAFQADKTDEAKFEEMKKEIEKLEKKTPARNLLEDELFIEQSKAKTKLLGYMRFIGELFKLKMLTEPIMHDCIFKLLRAKDDESLECMSQLMTTVGKDLDHERAKNRMDQYFTQISKITRNKGVSARIRFMLQDVEDLRRNHWVPRRDGDNPKTIAQIHKEAKQEEQQKNIESQMIVHSTRSREKSSRGRPPPVADNDWQTVSVNKARPQVDPSKLINLSKNRLDNDNVQLGPGGRPGAFGSWGRGSSGGGAKTQSTESVELRPNRYAMLSDQGRGSSRPSGMAPPTRDSKGRPTGNMSGGARRSRERDEGGRGSSREDSQKRERRQLLDEVSRTVGGNRSSRSIEKERLPSRDGGSARGSRDGGSRDRGSRDRGSRDRGSRDRGSWEKAPERKPAKSPVSTLSDEDIETKGKATLDEYLNIRDMKEACQCITELNSPDRLHLFVRLSIEHTLEMNTKKRLHTGELFSKLIAEKILSVQQYLKGLSEIVEFADDMAIDIPLIWQYLGELMGSMIQDKSQSIDFLKEALEPLRDIGKAGLLLAEIMKTAEQFIGADGMNELWHASGLKWDQFLPKDENIAEFVKEKKLEYTLSVPQSMKENPIALMENSLSLIIASGAKVDEVFDWIEKHIDPEKTKSREFIRALVTIVCQSTITSAPKSGEPATIRSDPEVLKVRAKCLLKYIDGDVDKELQALYAVQALNHKLVNPPGLLRIIFDVLYDEDVISEDTFYAWQNSKDPAEQGGKGVALKSVTSFFAWLGEAEDDPAN